MEFTRRGLLRGGTALLASSSLPLKWFGIICPEMAGADTLGSFTQSSFTPYVNTKFRVSAGSSPVDLVLMQVAPGTKVSTTGECFSLLFTGPRAKPFAQDTYTVSHASLGTFSMFLAAVEPPGKSLQYEAIFNRP